MVSLLDNNQNLLACIVEVPMICGRFTRLCSCADGQHAEAQHGKRRSSLIAWLAAQAADVRWTGAGLAALDHCKGCMQDPG